MSYSEPSSVPSSPRVPEHLISPALALQPFSRPQLVASQSELFNKNLFSRTLLDTTPPTVRIACTQLGFLYSPIRQAISYNTTSNLWKHYKHSHAEIYHAVKTEFSSSSQASHISDTALFFQPRASPVTPNNAAANRRFTKGVLQFIVSNNISMKMVGSLSFRLLLHHLNLTVLMISPQTVTRNFEKMFIHAKSSLMVH